MTAPPLNGRRAQAARNDGLILAAARAVFIADSDAPIAAVAARAGVGIGPLYHRYPSKDALLQRLCLDGWQSYRAAAEAALADEGDPWDAFDQFMRRCLGDGAGALTHRFAGHFAVTDDLRRASRAGQEITQRLIERTTAAGALRPDLVVSDLFLVFEQLQAIQVGDERRTHQLRLRYLALLLDALHTPAAAPLPGPPPRWDEISRRSTDTV